MKNLFIGRLEADGNVTHLVLRATFPALVTLQCSVLAIGGHPLLYATPAAAFAPDIAQRFLPNGSSSLTSDALHPRYYLVDQAVATAGTNVYLLAHKQTPFGTGTVNGGVLQRVLWFAGSVLEPDRQHLIRQCARDR